MRRLLAIALLLAGCCWASAPRAPEAWHPAVVAGPWDGGAEADR